MIHSNIQYMSRNIIVHPSLREGRFCCNLRQIMSHYVVGSWAIPNTFHWGVSNEKPNFVNEIFFCSFVWDVRIKPMDGDDGIREDEGNARGVTEPKGNTMFNSTKFSYHNWSRWLYFTISSRPNLFARIKNGETHCKFHGRFIESVIHHQGKVEGVVYVIGGNIFWWVVGVGGLDEV